MFLSLSVAAASLREDGGPLLELVERARAGDDAAFEQLFLRLYPSICSFLVYMLGHDEVGADLAQETFLKAWQALPTLRQPERFDGWLYQIARRLAANYLRRQKLIGWLPWKEQAARLRVDAAAQFEEGVGERLLLMQALATVSPRYRDCVILQIIHELPQQRIAELLNLSKNSVSTYTSRGLEQLQRAYAQLDEE